MDPLLLPGPSNPRNLPKQPNLYKTKRRKDEDTERSAEDIAKYTKSTYTKKKIPNKKLASHLNVLAEAHKRSAQAAYEHDHFLAPSDNAGLLEAENELERTWKVTQDQIKDGVGSSVAAKGFELSLDQSGPYDIDYTPNGRHLAIAGRNGHVATFDWITGKLHTEINLNETVRNICWLHDQSYFAVAQKKHVYIYDHDGLEIHQLKNHIDVNRMEFLRYHFLLATIGNAGWLKYQDTSTGKMVTELRTKLGSCDAMAQNIQNGMIHLGHQNGTVSLWAPNTPEAQVKILSHGGAVKDIAVDASGQYMATSGFDGKLKLWDMRKWATLTEWSTPKPAQSLAFSQKGLLAVGWGAHVTIYKDAIKPLPSHLSYPGPYMNHLLPGSTVHSLAYSPFEDLLGVGHERGIVSLLVPGSGEPNFDSVEADPFENKKARREREVNMLLDKVQPSLIAQDPDFVGKMAMPTTSAEDQDQDGDNQKRPPGWARLSRREKLSRKGEMEERGSDDDGDDGGDGIYRGPVKLATSSKKVRGKRKQLKRLRRREQFIVDAKTMALKEKIAKRKAQKEMEKQGISVEGEKPKGALGRFSKFTQVKSGTS